MGKELYYIDIKIIITCIIIIIILFLYILNRKRTITGRKEMEGYRWNGWRQSLFKNVNLQQCQVQLRGVLCIVYILFNNCHLPSSSLKIFFRARGGAAKTLYLHDLFDKKHIRYRIIEIYYFFSTLPDKTFFLCLG